MSAPIANDHFDFSLGNLSYINSAYDEPYIPAKWIIGFPFGLRGWC